MVLLLSLRLCWIVVVGILVGKLVCRGSDYDFQLFWEISSVPAND